jgi:cob(I)alamin adenosyltransferase
LTSLYTRTGDGGQTSTFGGERVTKTHPRVEAYGTVDELNTTLGLVAIALGDWPELEGPLRRVQNELFSVGADLATPPGPAEPHVRRVPGEWTVCLEEEIDAWQFSLPPLTTFVLPGGGAAGGAFHFARAVCRRSERACLSALEAGHEQNPEVVRYLNRLSDWLFAAARKSNQLEGRPDVVWHQPEDG